MVREAIEGGADAVQLRDKTASARQLCQQAEALRRLTRDLGARLIINDRIDVALAVDADGVHLGQDDIPAPDARRIWGRLGCSASPRRAPNWPELPKAKAPTM